MISSCRFLNLNRAGIYSQFNLDATNHQGNFISNCSFTGCGNGIFWDTRAEYNSVVNCKAYANTTGYRIAGGNNNFTGGSSTNNTNGVIVKRGEILADNNSHGIITGMMINHNTTWGVWCDSIGSFGQLFDGCNFYQNDIWLRADTGVNFSNCEFYVTNFNVQNCVSTQFEAPHFILTANYNFKWNGTNNTGTLSPVTINNPNFNTNVTVGLASATPTSYNNRYYSGLFKRSIPATSTGIAIETGDGYLASIIHEASKNINFYTNGSNSTPKVAITDGGYLGIGSTSTINSTDLLGIDGSTSGGITTTFRNSSTNSAAYFQSRIQNSTSAYTWGITSTGYTPSGIFAADGAFMQSTGAGGLSICASNAAGVIRLYSGSTTESLRLTGSTLNFPVNGSTISATGTGSNGLVLKNLKNSSNTAVTGTAKTIEIDIAGTPYYFLVYPTSNP